MELESFYLEEFRDLRSEILKRYERQGQSYYFLIVVIGACLTGVSTLLTIQARPISITACLLACAVIGVLPCLTNPLAALFFDDELLILTTEIYITDSLFPRLRWLGFPSGQSQGAVSMASALEGTLRERVRLLRSIVGERARIPARRRRMLFFFPLILGLGFSLAGLLLTSLYLWLQSGEILGPWLVIALWSGVSVFAVEITVNVVYTVGLVKMIRMTNSVFQRMRGLS